MGTLMPTRVPTAPPAEVPASQPVQPPGTGVAPQVDEVSRIEQVLAQPAIQAALLQFGTQMLQPPGFGDTFGGRLGRALGEAGAAAGRVQANQQQQQAEQARQDIARREVGARETTAAAQQGQVGVARDRNEVLREQLRAQIDSNIAAGERATRDFALRQRGQNIDVFNAIQANNARRAQALIEAAELTRTPEEAAGMLQEAARISEPLPFDIIMGMVEGERTQTTADALMTQARRAGAESQMAQTLQSYGFDKEMIARAQQTAQETTAREEYAPIPAPIHTPGVGAGPQRSTAPIPAGPAGATTAPGAGRINPATQTRTDRATAAVQQIQGMSPGAVTAEQFAAIQNDPFLRNAARRLWGDQYNELSARFARRPQQPRGRGILGVQ